MNPAIPVALPDGRWEKKIETESAPVSKENWEAMYQRLSGLRGKDGRLRLSPALSDLRWLAEWMLEQTLRHALLSQEQIKRLLDLGLDFGYRSTKWYRRFFEVCDHLRRHGRISSISPQGLWITAQRHRRKIGDAFNMQQIAWMNDLGMRFEPWEPRRRQPRKSFRRRLEDTHTGRYEERFHQLEAFKEKYGHCKVPHKSREFPGLRRWLLHLPRAKGRKGSPDLLARLEALGVVWETRDESEKPNA